MNLPLGIRQISRFVGLDRAIVFTLLSQVWTVVAGPVTLFFLATFLSPQEQGFYYTFGSVLGLQVFLELGLGFVLLQFSSHEWASLTRSGNGVLEGDPKAKARLSSLLRQALLWYGVVSGIAGVALLGVGLWFFQRYQPGGLNIMWRGPWIWVVSVAVCNLLLTPIFAILEGCGLIAELAILRLAQAVTTSVVSWILFGSGWKLLVAPAFNTVSVAMTLGWLFWRQKTMLLDLARFRFESVAVNWKREVWPFQWQIALSGVSSFFVFMLFNPVLFAFQGSVVAGQMGMSSALLTACAMGAGAWINTKLSPFGNLVARGDWEALDRLFFPALWQSLILICLGGSLIWLGAFYLQHIGHHWGQRVLAPLPLGLFIATTVVNHVVGSQALYLRAHKQDPFMLLSVINGCFIGLSTYFLGRYTNVTAMMAGYFCITLVVGLGLGSRIFTQKRRQWHSEPTSNGSRPSIPGEPLPDELPLGAT